MTPLDLAPYRFADGTLRRYTDLGGYPLFYLTGDSGVLCADCASHERPPVPDAEQTPDWAIVAVDANWEDPELYCDHCSTRIESAYADDPRSGAEPEVTPRDVSD